MFEAKQLVQVIDHIAHIGVKGSEFYPFASAALSILQQPKPEEVAHLSRGLLAILDIQALRPVSELAGKVVPIVKAWETGLTTQGMTRLVDLVVSLMKGGVHLNELFDAAAKALVCRAGDLHPAHYAPLIRGFADMGVVADDLSKAIAEAASKNIRQFPPSQIASLVKAFSEGAEQPEELFKAAADFATEACEYFPPADIADIAYVYWSLSSGNTELMKKIGEVTTNRLYEFTKEQLEQIETAYGASGFEVPPEWIEQEQALANGGGIMPMPQMMPGMPQQMMMPGMPQQMMMPGMPMPGMPHMGTELPQLTAY
jgi:hypothetical protein